MVVVFLTACLGMTVWGEREKRRRTELAFLHFRAALDRAASYRAPLASDKFDVRLRAAQNQFEPIAAQMKSLGDLVTVFGDEQFKFVQRVFVDDSALIVGTAIVDAEHRVELSVASYGNGEEWVTGTEGDEAMLPNIHRQQVPESSSVSEMLAAHRRFALGRTGLSKFETLDDVIAAYKRSSEALRAWRREQSPYDLLQFDLRLMLGSQYARVGPTWTRRLQKAGIAKARAL